VSPYRGGAFGVGWGGVGLDWLGEPFEQGPQPELPVNAGQGAEHSDVRDVTFAMSAFALMRDSHWAEILILSAWDLCGSRRGCEGIFLFDCHIGSARSREFVWTLLPCEMSRRS
jgi:hypothetical protein